jgi:LPS export ABC transporter protein LptC
MKLTKLFVLGITIAMLVATIVYLASNRGKVIAKKCTSSAKEMLQPSTTSEDISLNNIHLTESKSGRLVWEMNANTAVVDKNNRCTIMKPVSLKFYGQNGDVFSLKGKSCKVDTNSKNIFVEGKTNITSQKGLTLCAENLWWDSGKEILFMPGQVFIKYQGIEIQGSQMKIDINTKNFKIEKGVTTIITF